MDSQEINNTNRYKNRIIKDIINEVSLLQMNEVQIYTKVKAKVSKEEITDFLECIASLEKDDKNEMEALLSDANDKISKCLWLQLPVPGYATAQDEINTVKELINSPDAKICFEKAEVLMLMSKRATIKTSDEAKAREYVRQALVKYDQESHPDKYKPVCSL